MSSSSSSAPPPTATTTAAAAASAFAPSKICFNSLCKEPRSEASRRKGWRLRSGAHAELCDRCCLAYEQGTFCESFHSDAAGWRKCEPCGKRVHCGCIASVPFYVLLDAGGVECVVCARKGLSMAPNHMWSQLHMSSQVSERPKEQHPVRSWTQMTSSFPGQWRQGTHLWSTGVQSDLQQRLSLEFDRPNAEKLIALRSSISAQEKRVAESCSLNHVVRNGTAGVDPALAFNKYQQRNPDGRLDSGHVGDNDTISARKEMLADPCSTSSSGVNFEMHPNCAKPFPSSTSSLFGLASPFSSANGSNDLDRLTPHHSQRQMAPSLPKQLPSNSHNMNDSSGEMRNGRPRMDVRARSQLLPRYWPRITDQELQQISGDSNSIITPLFEKMLSASDAGRIGRLVLPKKCAEAYFPPISLPEGLPLKVQDAGGKEWVFQFRFWPNNNSRMYVLEGVTPCIQSMKLQAGDTVTFSRIDPEGKLVMGFRKASNVLSEQDNPTDNSKVAADINENGPPQPQKGSLESRNPANAADHATCSKFDKTGFIQKNGPAAKSSQGLGKRKGSILGSKSKRLRIENVDSVELKLTWEEAQGLLRPHPNDVPCVVVIEGHEIEEYEEAPVLGKPTIFTTNQAGDSYQWAQCEDCSKWRKLPADAFLPSRWSCTENKWDLERSLCSSAEETSKELTDLLTKTGSRRTRVKAENSDNMEESERLDTLANLAILGEGVPLQPSSQPTTRHPRHRPGCTCIVCIQPPSGKGPKHKQSCTCNVCLTVKRRFKTLMMRREKRQSEKEAETASTALNKESLDKSQEMPSPSPGSSSPQSLMVYTEDDTEKRITLPSPLKAQIDLNIQPEREEELQSLVSDAYKFLGE